MAYSFKRLVLTPDLLEIAVERAKNQPVYGKRSLSPTLRP